jgi:hypothetical protein
MANVEDAFFIVQRGGTAFKCKGEELGDKLEDGDYLLVQRGDITYKIEVDSLIP